MLVELRGDSADLGQIVPGASWEIVVFNVVAQVEVEEIPDSEIVVSFLSRYNFVVFGNCVNGGRVGSNGDESDDQQVQNSVYSPQLVDEKVGGKNKQEIDCLTCGEFGVAGIYKWP